MTKYNHIQSLPVRYNKTIFQKESHTWQENRKAAALVRNAASSSREAGWTAARGLRQARLATPPPAEPGAHGFSKRSAQTAHTPARPHSPYTPCSRCQQGCYIPTRSTPPRTGTALSGCLQWSACATQKECFTEQFRDCFKKDNLEGQSKSKLISIASEFCILIKYFLIFLQVLFKSFTWNTPP